MAITLHRSRTGDFQIVRFAGRLTFEGLAPLGKLHQALPGLAAADVVHIVDDNADLSMLTTAHMDQIRAFYTELLGSMEFYMVRRAAWVCPGPARAMIGYLLAGRNSRDGLGTEVRLTADLPSIAPLFSEEEVKSVIDGASFTEILRIN